MAVTYAAAVSTPSGGVRQPQIQARACSDPDLRASFEAAGQTQRKQQQEQQQQEQSNKKPQRPGAGIRSKTSFRGWTTKKEGKTSPKPATNEPYVVEESRPSGHYHHYHHHTTRHEHRPNTGAAGSRDEQVYVLTLKLSDDLAKPMDSMRNRYFPKHLNRTGAHLTLFHALPCSHMETLERGLLHAAGGTKPFDVSTGKPFRMRKGVGINVDEGYSKMKNVHGDLQAQWLEFLSEQDAGGFRPHWTVMNKVDDEGKVDAAFTSIRQELGGGNVEGRALGLELWRYERGNWIFEREFVFGDAAGVVKTPMRAHTEGEESLGNRGSGLSPSSSPGTRRPVGGEDKRPAIILVGGFGTRLRPLTLTYPKPLVEFANKPMIQHQIEALADAGVTDVVLAVNYRPEIMAEALKTYEKQYGVTITFSVETEPLGTAGPLKLAENVLGKDDSPFFVLNADVTCDYPFKQLAAFHKQHGDEGTIVVTKVEEPSKYGVVVHKPGHASKIDRFVEKPVEFVGNRINAGIYIMNTSVLKRIELRPTSIEQETFPAIVKDGLLHSFDLEGFWMDVGQPKDFLSGTCLYLSSLARKNSKLLTPASEPYVYGGNVLIDASAKIGKNCRIGPNVTIGPDVVIGDSVRLQRCVLLKNSRVKDHAWVKSSIVGWNSTVGKWARLENVTVLGDDVTIGDEVYVNGGSVLPHKSIKQNVDTPSIIM
ncbi:mannose-1-phosphate guanylyltransferase [Alternaria panax]|uniref:Mannose-1-phosphate guanyltransferase n=1 Tax=Alternaria panax TaxID=48097 RepID=A0AAD4FHB7_9PLEO|nr:mannose-1-phosphate guanylyltransferase [Alternaria panax]